MRFYYYAIEVVKAVHHTRIDPSKENDTTNILVATGRVACIL